MFRKENGVTLVALVVTIIVLLILAGVTIAMVLGEGGMIARASETTVSQQAAEIRDHVSMALADARTDDVAFMAGVGAETDPRDTAIEVRVGNYLSTDIGYTDVDSTTANTVKVGVKDGQGADWTVTVTITTTNGNYSIDKLTTLKD